jgi:rhodanese-related sulfurtransferase
MTIEKKSLVTEVDPGPPALAQSHFESLLSLETDCSDVRVSMSHEPADFVLLDVRGPNAFRAGHVEGAEYLPHTEITEIRMASYPRETVFVVYCAGPHCNGADKAALRLARLGHPVKKMIGGIAGWRDEGFELVSG